jgi:hypothetical protein
MFSRRQSGEFIVEPSSTGKAIQTTITIGLGVYRTLEKQGVWDGVRDWLASRKPQDILMLGASGAGKTSCFKSIRGLNPYVPRTDRSDKVSEAKGKIEKNDSSATDRSEKATFRLIDTPGHEDHTDKRRNVFLKVYNRRPLGILNVVSYGYHEGTGRQDAALQGHKPIPKFLEDRRQDEINRLHEWTSLLCGKEGPAAWLVTVVTKADLWWGPDGDDQPVLDYYRSGPYHTALGDAQTITTSVRPCSSLNQLFYDDGPMSGYYSDKRRAEHWNSLIALLLERSSEH